MATFGRNFQSQAVDRVARLQTMAEMPFTLSRNLGEQFQQGIVDSFGLGTAVRDIAIPAGNTTRPNPAQAIPGPFGAIAMGYEGARNLINGMRRDQPSLSEDEYKASPYFREEIPYEQGMTEDRAAALATFYDTKQVRDYFGQKRPFSTFIGQLGGQALDPINYVPVFGQAAEAAAVARIGTIAGRALIGAGDAAINTAAFGLLTAGLREQYGDDTSWQAMTSEIAISALIGGAFGGVSGVISNAYTAVRGRADRQAVAAAADRLTDLRAIKESRAVLNEAVGEMAAGRDIGLSPNGQAAVERIQAEAVGEARASRALAEQTAAIPDGARVVITPAGSRVEVVPEVVELDSLVNASGALQVRNRSTQASAVQVEQIATELDPARLMTSVDADSGAPVIGADNVVDSGNGRVMAIRRAAEAYPERYNAYKKALADAGYGIDGFRQPVLVSRRVTPLSEDARAKFNAEANAPRAAQMSAVELAAMDRNALDGTLDVLDPSPVTSAGNRAFVQRFLGNLAPSARGALIDGAGNLNADGVRRIENALVAEAYGDVDLGVLRRFAEATDDNTRAIVGAMSDVAGKWALMRRDVKLGNISAEFDMTAELTEALRLIGGWREQAAREGRPVSMVIREGMAQIDLLSGEISPETQAMVSAFYQTNSFARAAGRDTIAELLSRIVDAAQELGRPQLFGDLETTKLEVLRYAASNEQGNLFTPVGTVDGIEADGGFNRGAAPAADRQDAGQGARQGSIADRMTRRFEAAGRPADEARATAEIVDAFYVQQAARLGVTVDDLEARFGLPEVRQGGDIAADAVAQSPQSPAFREWFGDSKVVDENGDPLVVYHGTPGKPLEQFDPNAKGKTSILFSVIDTHRQGFYFAEKEGFAAGFAEQNGRSRGSVMPVYLSIQNPLDVTSMDNASVARLEAVAARMQEIDPEINNPDYIVGKAGWDDFWELLDTDEGGDVLVQAARDLGYDGIKMIETDRETSDPDYEPDDNGAVTWVAFDPTQIKSVNNRGTFDPNDPRILFQVSPDQARAIDIETQMPTDAAFAEAVANTPGASITDDGLLIDLVRYQKPEQAGSTSVRTGVFYLPTGSAQAKYYKGGKNAYGGKVEVRGETLIKRPIFVKGATGGKAPESAFDQIKGKGAYEKMRGDVLNAIRDKRMIDERGYNLLEEYGADGNMIWEIVPNSTEGNTLAYALQENIVAHAVREAGFDAVVGYSVGRGGKGSFISEVFDVREIDYPTPGETATLHPQFETRTYNQPAYHGTPHLFDKFSTDHIGTGEGAQAYGWGLYFSSSKDVSKWYREKLAGKRSVMLNGGVTSDDLKKPLTGTYDWIEENLPGLDIGDLVGADDGEAGALRLFLNNFEQRLREGYERDQAIEVATTSLGNSATNRRKEGQAEQGDRAEAAYRVGLEFQANPNLITIGTPGRLFEVDVPSDDELLNWNARLADQPKAVREAIASFDIDLDAYANDLFDGKADDLTGEMLYEAIGSHVAPTADGSGDPRATSEALAAAGVPGHQYVGRDSGTKNYVIYEDARVQVTSFDQGGDNPRGAIQLGDTNIISLFETADASTALHETGHLFLSMLKGMGEAGDAPDAIKADWESVREWWRANADAVAADANASGRAEGVTGKNVIDALDLGTTGDAAKDRAIDVGMQEQWARGFEAYVREGNAPTAGLARAFEQFKQWLTAIYRRATDLNVNLSPEIRQVFDNLLGAQEPTARAVPTIDGMPVRVAELDNGRPAPAEPATAQASLMLNEPDNAAARVGRDDTIRDIALSHGVDPNTGAFVEAGDIEQLRQEGRLLPEDEAELADADQMFADAEAFGRALDAAVACVI